MKRKIKISQTERARRRTQALKNFGHRKTKTRSVNKIARKRSIRRAAPRKRASRRSSAGKIFSTRLLWLGVGSGASGLLGGVVNKFAPTVAGNIAGAVGGGALAFFGKGVMRTIGQGALVKAIGDFVEENIMTKINIGINSTSESSSSPSGEVI